MAGSQHGSWSSKLNQPQGKLGTECDSSTPKPVSSDILPPARPRLPGLPTYPESVDSDVRAHGATQCPALCYINLMNGIYCYNRLLGPTCLHAPAQEL